MITLRKVSSARKWTSLALLVAMCSGCHRHREILFGMYAAPQEELREARGLGIDFVVGPKRNDYLNAAARAGLKVIGTGNEFPQHHALMGHYLRDEPDLHNIGPDEVAKEYREVKRKSRKAVFLNVSSGYSVEEYVAYCDVVTFDWYPVGWQPIETFNTHLRVARLAAREKEFFAIVQAFDWSKYPMLMKPSERQRKPTAEEVKAMAVWAAMGGAAGIIFYPYDDGTTRLKEHPELMEAVRGAISFIRTREEYFTGKKIPGPYPFQFEDQAQTYNAVYEVRIATRYSELRAGGREKILVAANTTDAAVRVTPKKEVIFGTAGTIEFQPFEVKVFNVTFRE